MWRELGYLRLSGLHLVGLVGLAFIEVEGGPDLARSDYALVGDADFMEFAHRDCAES